MFNLLLVVVGGGIGAGIRHLTNMGALRLVGPNYPWGTMAINILGSFAMGLFIAIMARRGGPNEVRLFVATGILGGFTTFSSFGWEMFEAVEKDTVFNGAANVVLSVVLGYAAVWLGAALTGWLARVTR